MKKHLNLSFFILLISVISINGANLTLDDISHLNPQEEDQSDLEIEMLESFEEIGYPASPPRKELNPFIDAMKKGDKKSGREFLENFNTLTNKDLIDLETAERQIISSKQICNGSSFFYYFALSAELGRLVSTFSIPYLLLSILVHKQTKEKNKANSESPSHLKLASILALVSTGTWGLHSAIRRYDHHVATKVGNVHNLTIPYSKLLDIPYPKNPSLYNSNINDIWKKFNG